MAVTGDAFNFKSSPIDDINSKNPKTKLKSSRKYSTNHIIPKSRHYHIAGYFQKEFIFGYFEEAFLFENKLVTAFLQKLIPTTKINSIT